MPDCRLQSANGSQAVAPVTTGTNGTLTLAQFNQALSNGSASGQPAAAESLSNSTLALATVGALLLATLLSHTYVRSALANPLPCACAWLLLPHATGLCIWAHLPGIPQLHMLGRFCFEGWQPPKLSLC